MSHKYAPNYEPRLFHGNWSMKKRWYVDFRVWDTDKQKFVRKQCTSMNKYTTLAERKKDALKSLKEIQDLIKSGVVTGEQPAEPEHRFDLKTFTTKQAFTYFLNYKNATLASNEEHNLITEYNKGKARVSIGTYKAYKGLMTKVMSWLSAQKQDNLRLAVTCAWL